MDEIGSSPIWSFGDDPAQATPTPLRNSVVRRSEGHSVASYLELAKKIAALQFENPHYVLLFRGQAFDYRNSKRASSLKPSIFRPLPGKEKAPSQFELRSRFELLNGAATALADEYLAGNFKRGNTRTKRERLLRWAVIQHYEVCATPLLDVTHSLRVAASFASEKDPKTAFIYVLGVPNLSGTVTVSAESGLQVLRLSGVCPPAAVRPHIQEGYLVGEYPDMPDFDQKQHYPEYEIDLGRRLIAKFRFEPDSFWQDKTFTRIPNRALYPDAHDPFFKIASRLKDRFSDQ